MWLRASNQMFKTGVWIFARSSEDRSLTRRAHVGYNQKDEERNTLMWIMKTLKLKLTKRTIHRFAQWNHTGETVPKQFQHCWVALLKVLTNLPILILMLTIILILPLTIPITTPPSFQDLRYCLSKASSVQILQHRGHRRSRRRHHTDSCCCCQVPLRPMLISWWCLSWLVCQRWEGSVVWDGTSFSNAWHQQEVFAKYHCLLSLFPLKPCWAWVREPVKNVLADFAR